jgi:hypothetical protein
MYKTSQAQVEVQCDNDCCARTGFFADSITDCKRKAREAGWMLSNQLDSYGRGRCLCPKCNERNR